MMARVCNVLLIVYLLRQTAAQSAASLDVSECDVSKTCMLNPAGCGTSTPCLSAVSWKNSSSAAGSLDFELFGAGAGWVAVGLSTDGLMGNDSVIQCTQSGNVVSVKYSYNTGKSNSLLADPTSDVTMTEWSFTNSQILCRFSRPLSVTRTGADAGKVASLSTAWYLLLAYGTTPTTGSLSYHAARKYSEDAISVTAPIPITTPNDGNMRCTGSAVVAALAAAAASFAVFTSSQS